MVYVINVIFFVKCVRIRWPTTYSFEVEVEATGGGFVGVNTEVNPGSLGGLIVLVTDIVVLLADP